MNDIREDLKAYLDGELSPERAGQIEQALAESQELREEADFYRMLSNSIASHAKAIPVEGLDKAVDRAVQKPSFWRTWLVPIAAGAVVLMLGGVMTSAIQESSQRPQAKSASGNAVTLAGSAEYAPASAPPSEFSPPGIGGPPAAGAIGDAAKGVGGAGSAMRTRSAAAAESAAAPLRSVPSILENRQVIRTASISLRVKDVAGSRSQAEQLAAQFGGYVESSVASFGDSQTNTANLVLKVDSRRYSEAMSALRKLGEVRNESSGSDDVTAQIVDMEARVRTLRAEEESLRQILKEARRIGDVLAVRDRLTQVRQEIESLDSQSKALRGLAALATINLSIEEAPSLDKPKDEPWLEDSWTSATRALQAALRTLFAVFAYVVALSPFWIIALLIVWLVVRKVKKG